MQMRRYWLYQVLGWSAYSLVGIAINTLNGAALGPLLVGHALLISFSIGLTHWLRHTVKRRPPNKPMWPRLAIGALLISEIQVASPPPTTNMPSKPSPSTRSTIYSSPSPRSAWSKP